MPTVLCFGDSNTFGTPPMVHLEDKRRFGPDIRWPWVMRRALGERWHLVEEGNPGRTTTRDDPDVGPHRNATRVFPAILESHWPIDVMVFMLGTNDLKAVHGVAADTIAEDIRGLITFAKGTGFVARTLLVCPPMVQERGCLAEVFAGAEARGQGLADHIHAVAAKTGAAFFDANSVIATDPLDGVHFGPEAHDALGRALADEVAKLMGAS
ncbi:SGNH/GDSL hydrolase family protein [Shimia biformata]|uniref:SGNH/GDSL hydrolase family protein n=1 Tax=Shimia biformata TaxID=1294299 RepID=UPI0019501E98|nr:SGNH/GDSL hydrolase family protein [Shimia biformata]